VYNFGQLGVLYFYGNWEFYSQTLIAREVSSGQREHVAASCCRDLVTRTHVNVVWAPNTSSNPSRGCNFVFIATANV